MGVYLFSDIHGNFDALQKIQARWVPPCHLNRSRHAICCGDLIDRGDRSAKVVVEWANVMRSSASAYFVVGNHEWLLLEALMNAGNDQRWESRSRRWMGQGGSTLCGELGKNGPFPTPNNFVTAFAYLLENRFGKIHVRTRHTYVATHAGIAEIRLQNKKKDYATTRLWAREGRESGVYGRTAGAEEKSRFDMWGRGTTLDNDNRKYHVFGHSPTDPDVIRHRWEANRESVYDDYATNRMWLLPIDAGLARKVNGTDAGVALAHIEHPTGNDTPAHSMALLNTPGKTDIRYQREDYLTDRQVKKGCKRLREAWRDFYHRLPQNRQTRIRDCFFHRRVISWVPMWHNTLGPGAIRDYRTKIIAETAQPLISDLPPWVEKHPLEQYIRKRRSEGNTKHLSTSWQNLPVSQRSEPRRGQ